MQLVIRFTAPVRYSTSRDPTPEKSWTEDAMEPVELSLWNLLSEAGWTMAPIYLCSIAAIAVFVKKLVDLESAGVGRKRLLNDGMLQPLIEKGDLLGLEEVARADKSALGRAMAFTALSLRTRPDKAEEETIRFAKVLLGELSSAIAALAFIAQVSPLFGLLGTVIGMVDLFSAMEASGHNVDTSVLSSGIWKALLTTAAGLIVGIPALAGHAWLTARIETLRRHVEDGTSRILNGVPASLRGGGPAAGGA